MKKLIQYILLIASVICFMSCHDDKICTTCTEQINEATTSFCGEEVEVQGFENTVLSQAEVGEIWLCVRT